VPKIPEGPDGQPLRALFYRLDLDPTNPRHWEKVGKYLEDVHPGGFAAGPYMPEDNTTTIRERRPRSWDGLALRRLAQRVEIMHAWYPKESELAICKQLAKHCPDYQGRGLEIKKMSARTLQRRLGEARKRGLA
jgi:hypothetical protein